MRDEAKYDRLGIGYTKYRRPDPRLVQAIIHHLGLPPQSTVADIGAGTGSYSAALAAAGFSVKAVEPSQVMRGQAVQHECVEWYAGVAEDIPLPDRSVAGAIWLRKDLESGAWQKAYGSILEPEEFDAGYRFVRVGEAQAAIGR